MKILKNTYHLILENTPILPPETGGILGGYNGIISTVQFDQDSSIHNTPAIYYPNISLFNQIIKNWGDIGIVFYGIFHSHYTRNKDLSTWDKKYIYKIMQAMPSHIQQLYFPIVFPHKTILGYQASKKGSLIHITCSEIEIIQN